MKNINWHKTAQEVLELSIIVSLMMAITSCGWFHSHPRIASLQDRNDSAPRAGMANSGVNQNCCNYGWRQQDMWGPGRMGPEHRQRMIRHRTYMQSGLPSEYRGQVNPLSFTAEVIEAGAGLYNQQCASCHGPQGMGDGEAGRGLSPSPALLAHMIRMPVSADEYLMWTISEGGVPFGTAMPAFKDILPKEGIWEIIAFMRAGFPLTTTPDK
jgi:hypothetical protein